MTIDGVFMIGNQFDTMLSIKRQEEINNVIRAVLECLLGAGEAPQNIAHLIGTLRRSPLSVGYIGIGLMFDHFHHGYKHNTMRAFFHNLNQIFYECFIALKLLNNQIDDLDIDEINFIEDTERNSYLLKLLGFSSETRDDIINTFYHMPNDKIDYITFLLGNLSHEDITNLIQKIEFLLVGAQSYLPFSEPHDGDRVGIPFRDDLGQYQIAHLEIECLNLNHGVAGPYYALSLVPLQHDEDEVSLYQQDRLIFMGTNPIPTSHNPMGTFYADVQPSQSIGQSLLERNHTFFAERIKNQYSENIEQLIEIARNQNEVIDYQSIWLNARIKCLGQSLGASLCLQLLSYYPFMIEVAAFEPPFLDKKYKKIIEKNLKNSVHQFKELIESLSIDDNEKEALILSYPEDELERYQLLKANNIGIIQLIDIVTKFGTISPPVTLYQVQINSELAKRDKFKLFSYQLFMMMTGASHAMVLSSQNNIEIGLTEKKLDRLARHLLTQFYTQGFSRIVHPFLFGYFEMRFVMKKVFKTNHPQPLKLKRLEPTYLTMEILNKWSVLKRKLTNDDNQTFQGGQIYEKIIQLSKLLSFYSLLIPETVDYIQNEVIHFIEINDDKIRDEHKYLIERKILNIENETAQTLENALELLQQYSYVYTHSQPINVNRLHEIKLAILDIYPFLTFKDKSTLIKNLSRYIKLKEIPITHYSENIVQELRHLTQETRLRMKLFVAHRQLNKQFKKSKKRLPSHLVKKIKKNTHLVNEEAANQIRTEINDYLEKNITPRMHHNRSQQLFLYSILNNINEQYPEKEKALPHPNMGGKLAFDKHPQIIMYYKPNVSYKDESLLEENHLPIQQKKVRFKL